MDIVPVTLEGRHIRLEPLALRHLDGLCEVGLEESIWRWNPRAPVRTRADMQRYIDAALQQQADGVALPFATIEQASGQPVGSTRFHGMDREHLRVEIGYTWIAPRWQRSAVNTEAKYVMLRHAFETWGCVRVELKTDSLNEKSRTAIARLGAKEEGIFRNHMVTHNGRLRHSVYFSIIAAEWPAVKANLEAKLTGSDAAR